MRPSSLAFRWAWMPATVILLAGLIPCDGQGLGAADTATTPSSAPPSATPASSESSEGALPTFDPASEMVTWNGRNWNISNNRLFRARFEKYLNEPEENAQADQEYSALMKQMMDKLAPSRAGLRSLDEAFGLLAKAAAFKRDANLCDSIANQVYSVWLSQNAADRLVYANQSFENERKRLEWNLQMEADSKSLDATPSSKQPVAAADWASRRKLQQETRMRPLNSRLAEVNTLIKANQAKREFSQLQAKVEFQTLLVQLFFQRRFQHVLIASRFYRNLFADGDNTIKLGDDAKSFFSKTTGLPPTVGALEALAGQALRDVEQGISAVDFLMDNEELKSATDRLSETFILGEFTPEVLLFSREKKRQILSFYQKSQFLISALDSKDYGSASELIKNLRTSAKDADLSRAVAAVQTARTVSSMHLAKAKNAAISGDKAGFEEGLRAATEIWPQNPELAEVASHLFSQADVQQRALLDFDQLISQKNYRRIYEEKLRYIAATSTDAPRQKQLEEILSQMAEIEGSILRAQEVEKRGDPSGAWETIEFIYKRYPEDTKLSQIRSDLTTQATSFVSAIRQAENMEKKAQIGSSLAWYLKAQQLYPGSEFARGGIQRLITQIFPDAN